MFQRGALSKALLLDRRRSYALRYGAHPSASIPNWLPYELRNSAMKKIAGAVTLLLLSACASQTPPEFLEYQQYLAENTPRAEQGTLPWSTYYKSVYGRMFSLGAPAFELSRINSMIAAALSYESGSLTQEQFLSIRRESQAASRAYKAELDQQKRAQIADILSTSYRPLPIPAGTIYQNTTPISGAQIVPAPPLLSTGAIATWTGRQNMIQTVTYQQAWNCEYRYAGQLFWQVHSSTCPSSVNVR